MPEERMADGRAFVAPDQGRSTQAAARIKPAADAVRVRRDFGLWGLEFYADARFVGRVGYRDERAARSDAARLVADGLALLPERDRA